MNRAVYFFLFNLVVSIFVPSVHQAQIEGDCNLPYRPPEFLTNPPLWYYAVHDSTTIGIPFVWGIPYCEMNGYNNQYPIAPVIWRPVIEGDYLYGYTIVKGPTWHIYGAIVYKIDLRTGREVWKQVFDHRHLDRQEFAVRIKLRDDTVELVTMKRYAGPEKDIVPVKYNFFGDSSYVCIRKYHKTDGRLLGYDCWDREDSTLFIVWPRTKGDFVLEKREDGKYVCVWFWENDKTLELNLLDRAGHLEYQRVDTLYYPSEKYDLDSLRLGIVNLKVFIGDNDTIVNVYAYTRYKGDRLWLTERDLIYMQLYDKDLNLIKRVSLGALVDTLKEVNNVFIEHADDESITLYVIDGYRLPKRKDYHVIIDYDGRILAWSSYKPKEDEYVFFNGMRFLKYSQKPLMMTHSWDDSYPRELPQTVRYYLYENGEWVEKFSQQMGENHLLDGTEYIAETPDKDILLCVGTNYYYEDRDAASFDPNTWMLLDGSKLGLKTSTSDVELAEEGVRVYPNPVGGAMHIESDRQYAYVEVCDLMGRVVLRERYRSTIDVSGLSSGVYLVRLLDEGGKVHQVRMVKQ